MIDANDLTFDEDVLKSDIPVLVDFGAEWCPPCRALKPRLEELEKTYDGKIKFVQVDVDSSPYSSVGLQSIPTLRLYKAGKVVTEAIGALNKTQLEKLLNG
jgi:thioredoxin